MSDSTKPGPLKLPADLFTDIAHKVLAVYRNRASVEEPSRLLAHATRGSGSSQTENNVED